MKFKKRIFVKAAAAAFMIGAAGTLAACGGSGGSDSTATTTASSGSTTAATTTAASTSSASSSSSSEGKTLKLAYPSTITTLDVADGGGATMLKEVAGVIETLVNVSSDFELQPSLAKSWERKDDTTWEFKLRDDVKFHDGTDFTADAVKWCLERTLESNESFGKTSSIESVEVVDDHTVTIKTKTATGELPEALCNVSAAIVAKSSLNSAGEFEKPVGTGYFMHDSFDVSSGTFTCVKFDDYYEDVKTNVTKREVYGIADANTRSLAAQNHEVDIATDVPFSDLTSLANADGIKTEMFETARVYFYSFNLNKDYLKDVNVRKALIYAINEQELVSDALMGVGSVSKGIFMDKMPWANNDLDAYNYDVEKAKSLLDEAGVKDSDGDGYRDYNGQNLDLQLITGSRRPGNALICQATQGYFDEIGIKANVEVLDGNAQTEKIEKGEFDMKLDSAASGYVPSASYYLSQYYKSDSTNAKRIGYSNTELDGILDKCKAEVAGDEKNKISKEAQVICQEEVPVFTAANYGAVFVMNDKIENFSYSAAVHDFIVPYETSLAD